MGYTPYIGVERPGGPLQHKLLPKPPFLHDSSMVYRALIMTFSYIFLFSVRYVY